MKKEKEEIMTGVVTDIKDIMQTKEIKINCQTPKLDTISDFLRLKVIARKEKNQITKYIEKNKKVRNGRTVLKGTRITTKELLFIMSENKTEQSVVDYIYEQYPSIDCEEKVFYGALYEIGRVNSLLFITRVLFS